MTVKPCGKVPVVMAGLLVVVAYIQTPELMVMTAFAEPLNPWPSTYVRKFRFVWFELIVKYCVLLVP